MYDNAFGVVFIFNLKDDWESGDLIVLNLEQWQSRNLVINIIYFLGDTWHG